MEQYVVDAFTDKVFSGNSAAVCIIDKWLPDDLLMKITAENNLSETAFAVKNGEFYHLRWFTPGGEIDLCGHATLAAAFVITNFTEPDMDRVSFETLSGILTVVKNGDLFEMNFPAYNLKPVGVTDKMTQAIGIRPAEAYMGRDLLCILEHEADVRNIVPNQSAIQELDGLLLHVTAQGKEFDCVSRSFAPKCNVAEDPVCGSGHCHIIPYWANKLGKQNIQAYQASPRGGIIYAAMGQERVTLSGHAVLFSKAELFIDR